MSEASSPSAPEPRSGEPPVTGDDDVDATLADFSEAVADAVEEPGAAHRAHPAGAPEAEDQDQLASMVRAAEEAHRRLQQRLSVDRG